MIQQILAVRRSGNRSLKAAFRLGYKYVLALIDPVLGTFFMVFYWFLSLPGGVYSYVLWGVFLLSFIQELAVISEASKLHPRKVEQRIAELVI
jgi:hypothetical protein